MTESTAITLMQVFAHFCWQGALLGALSLLIASQLRRESVRYVIYCGALAAMALAPPITWLVCANSASNTNVVEQLPQGSDLPSTSERTSPTLLADADLNGTLERTPARLSEATRIESGDGDSDETRGDSAVAAYTVRWEQWAVWCCWAYLLGVVLMSFRLTRGVWCGWKMLRHARFETPIDANSHPELFGMIQRLSEQLQLRAAPAAAWCDDVATPAVLGVLRPAVLLPTSLASGLTLEEIRLLLAHELTHIRRYDTWVNLFQRVVEIALFFHPAVWIVSRRASRERENCCDAGVIQRLPDVSSPLTYVQALLRMAELTVPASANLPMQLTAWEQRRPSELRMRIERLLGGPQTQHSPAGLVPIIILLCVTAFVWCARAQDPSPAPPAKPPRQQLPKTDAKQTKTELHGVVLDADHLLAPTVKIEIYSLAPRVELVRTTTTDDTGWFEVKGLPRSRFTVQVSTTTTKAETQRIDLRDGSDFLLARLKDSLAVRGPRFYTTGAAYAMHGTWDAAFFPEKLAKQRDRTNFQLAGDEPKKDAARFWGSHHHGVDAALELPAGKTPQPIAVMLRNVTHRVVSFRLKREQFASLRLESQRAGGQPTPANGLAIVWPSLGGAERDMYEIWLRPGDVFRLPVTRPLGLDDLPAESLRLGVPLHSDLPDGATNPHVDSGSVTTGWTPVAVPLRKPKAPRSQVTFRGRVVDGKTGRPISQFQAVPASVSEYHEKSAHSYTWQDHLISKHANGNFAWTSRGYKRTRIRFDAPGYIPVVTKTHAKEDGEPFFDVYMYPAKDHVGAVVDRNGNPMEGVSVCRSTLTKEVSIRNGELRLIGNGPRLGKIVKSAPDGSFTLPFENEEGLFVASHPELGIAFARPRDFDQDPVLRLEAWCEIKGKIIDNEGEGVTDRIVWGSRYLDGKSLAPTVNIHQSTTSGADGAFRMTHLAPGYLHLQRAAKATPDEKPATQISIPGCLVKAELKPGEKKRVVLGDPAATVRGKLRSDQVADLATLNVQLVVPFSRFRVGAGAARVRTEFLNSSEGQAYNISKQPVRADGSFQFDKVPAGSFTLVVTDANGKRIRHQTRHVEVALPSDQKVTELGEVRLLP